MRKFKENKGITLGALILTVVVLLILLSVTAYNTIIGVDDATDAKYHSEVRMVQHAVLEQYVQFKTTKNVKYLVGDRLELSQVQQIAQERGITLVHIPDTYTNKDYYRLTKAHLEQIGISNVEDQYIVNYVSGEVINFSQKADSKGNPIYVQADNFKAQQ